MSTRLLTDKNVSMPRSRDVNMPRDESISMSFSVVDVVTGGLRSDSKLGIPG